MFSAEDECVDLDPTLYPTGNVEQWLLIVENSMKNTGTYAIITILLYRVYTELRIFTEETR